MTQIPEKIIQKVETSSLYDQEFSEVNLLIVDSGAIGCTFADTVGEDPTNNLTLSIANDQS